MCCDTVDNRPECDSRGHEHGHDHGHAHGLGGHQHGSGRVLVVALCLTLGFAVIEAIAGWLSGSLALLSDAGHMMTDTTALGIGALAAWLAQRPVSRTHSFGLVRSEVLGGAINVVLMLAVVVVIAALAINRFFQPAAVYAPAVLVVGTLGLTINLVVAYVLMRGEQNVNVRGALLHVFGDLLGSLAAIIAGAVILLTGWTPIDPLLSLFVCALILISAGRLTCDVVRVLMESVPRDIDADSVGRTLAEVDGVRSIHDLHIWHLSSTTRAMAAHVEVGRLADWQTILPRLETLLAERFAITHTTLQPEDRATASACDGGKNCGMAFDDG